MCCHAPAYHGLWTRAVLWLSTRPHQGERLPAELPAMLHSLLPLSLCLLLHLLPLLPFLPPGRLPTVDQYAKLETGPGTSSTMARDRGRDDREITHFFCKKTYFQIKFLCLHYRSTFQSASNDFIFGVDLVHRIIRPTVNKSAQSGG